MTSVCESQENQRWSKRGLPQQPQASDSIDARFQNLLVRPVYLLRRNHELETIRWLVSFHGRTVQRSVSLGIVVPDYRPQLAHIGRHSVKRKIAPQHALCGVRIVYDSRG